MKNTNQRTLYNSYQRTVYNTLKQRYYYDHQSKTLKRVYNSNPSVGQRGEGQPNPSKGQKSYKPESIESYQDHEGRIYNAFDIAVILYYQHLPPLGYHTTQIQIRATIDMHNLQFTRVYGRRDSTLRNIRVVDLFGE